MEVEAENAAMKEGNNAVHTSNGRRGISTTL